MRRGARPGSARSEQVTVGDGQIGVEHDHIGRDPLAVGGVYGPGPAAGHLDSGDRGPVAERDPVLAGRRGQRDRYGMDAARREVDPGDRVQVGDHRIQRERLVRREPGVHGLEREDPLRTRIPEELPDLGVQAPEPAGGREPQQVRGDEITRAVHVAVDEVVALQPPHPAGVRREAQVSVGLSGPAHAGHLGGHPYAVGDHVERRTVREMRPVGRIEPGQRRASRTCPRRPPPNASASSSGMVSTVGPGVERVTSDLQATGPPTRHRLALEDGHLPPGRGQAQCAGQPAQRRHPRSPPGRWVPSPSASLAVPLLVATHRRADRPQHRQRHGRGSQRDRQRA